MTYTYSTPTTVFQRTVKELEDLGFEVTVNHDTSVTIRTGVYPVAYVKENVKNIFNLNYSATHVLLEDALRKSLAELTHKLASIDPSHRVITKSVKLYAVYLPDTHFCQCYYVAKFEKTLALIPSFRFDPKLRTHLFTMEEIESFEETFRGFSVDYICSVEEQI